MQKKIRESRITANLLKLECVNKGKFEFAAKLRELEKQLESIFMSIDKDENCITSIMLDIEKIKSSLFEGSSEIGESCVISEESSKNINALLDDASKIRSQAKKLLCDAEELERTAWTLIDKEIDGKLKADQKTYIIETRTVIVVK